MIKTIFLDLDDTLLDFHRAESNALTGTLRQMGVEPTEAIIRRYSEINQRQWELLEEKKLTRDQVLLRRFDLLYEELGISRSSRETWKIYEGLLAQGHDLIPGAKVLLETLSERYDLYAASNGTASVQSSRIQLAGIGGYFRGMFISQEMGADKPSPEFFHQCFAAIQDFHPDQAILLGDSLTSDIRGGNLAGLKTCWYNPNRNPRRADILPDYEIHALEEFPPLLERL